MQVKAKRPMSGRYVVVFLLCVGFLSAAHAARNADPAVVEELVLSGWSALSAGDIKDARDMFNDILAVDSTNRRALRGLGFAYLKLGNFDDGRVKLEKSCDQKPGKDRALALNLASAHLRKDNHRRAVKLLHDLLGDAGTAAADEEALNALAIALNASPPAQQQETNWQAALKLYEAGVKKLEEGNPGRKRWGLEWVSEEEFKKRSDDWSRDRRRESSMAEEIARNENEQRVSERQIRQHQLNRNGRALEQEKRRFNDLVETHHRLVAERVDFVATKMRRPKFPLAIQVVDMPETSVQVVAVKPQAVKPPGEQVAVRPSQVETKKPIPPAVNEPVEPAPVDRLPDPPAVAEQPAKPRRQITKYAVAFPISDALLLTVAQAAEGASDLDIQTADGDSFGVEVVRIDGGSGLALLRAKRSMTAWLRLAETFDGGPIDVVGFPDVSIFDPVPTKLTGKSPPPAPGWKISLAKNPRLPGAPVISNNVVVGLVTASRDDEPRALPAATLQQVREFVGDDAAPAPRAAADAANCVYQLITRKESRE